MRSLSKVVRRMAVATMLGLLPMAGAVAAPIFGLTASSISVPHGGLLTINVTASGLTDLYAYQFSLNFNPALFQATIPSATEGPFLATAGSTFFDGGTIDNVGGQIGFVFDTLLGPGPGANGSGILDSFTFRVVGNAPAAGMFSLSDVLALNSGLNVIAVGTQTLVVTVPEPAPIMLLLIGVGAIGWLGLRRAKARGFASA